MDLAGVVGYEDGSPEVCVSEETPETPAPPAAAKAGFTETLEEYGGVFIGVVLFLFVIEMSVMVSLLRWGVDFGPVVAWVQNTLGWDASGVLESAGTIGVAYAITRLFKPFQLALAMALTPWVAKRIGKDKKKAAAAQKAAATFSPFDVGGGEAPPPADSAPETPPTDAPPDAPTDAPPR